MDRPEAGPGASEISHRGRQVVAHQIELVARLFGRVDGDFGGRQGEDELAAAGINRREPERIAHEVASGLRCRREQDDVRAAYQLGSPVWRCQDEASVCPVVTEVLRRFNELRQHLTTATRVGTGTGSVLGQCKRRLSRPYLRLIIAALDWRPIGSSPIRSGRLSPKPPPPTPSGRGGSSCQLPGARRPDRELAEGGEAD